MLWHAGSGGLTPPRGTTVWGDPAPEMPRQRGEALTPGCSSLDHKCSVFYAAPSKSKLLSTLCSADVCQCAEGEMRPGGQGWEMGAPSWSHLTLALREVP